VSSKSNSKNPKAEVKREIWEDLEEYGKVSFKTSAHHKGYVLLSR
jgi:hypothetical protein